MTSRFHKGGYDGTPIDEILPVSLNTGKDTIDTTRLKALLTPDGLKHPVTALRDLPAGLVVLGLGFIPHGIPRIPESESFYEIAVDLEQDGRPQDAVPLYRRALELSPDDSDAHLALGLALGRSGAAGEARVHLESALELRPDADVAWQGLGLWWQSGGNHRKALECVEKAVTVNPCNRRAAALLAQLLMDAGELARARAVLEDAVRRYPRRDAEVENARARLAALESGRAPASANR